MKGLAEERERVPNETRDGREELCITAVTVDFFRGGSYTPALPATASLALLSDSAALSNGRAETTLGSTEKPGQARMTSSSRSTRQKWMQETWARNEVSDMESEVCMVWLEVRCVDLRVKRAKPPVICSCCVIFPDFNGLTVRYVKSKL